MEVSPRTFGEIPQILIKSLEGLSVSEKKLELLQLLKLGEFFNQAGEFLDKKVFLAPPSHIEIGDCAFDFSLHPAAIRYQIKQQLINE